MIEIINQNLETISYIIAVVIIFSPLILKRKFGRGHIASLTITIGIFGTFFGVFIGLLNFNPDDITNSIPNLINGLQTAFITSLAGLLANLILRISPIIYGFKEEVTGKKSDNLVEQMVESLNRVADSISGDGDSTMVTQLQKIRTTNSDGFSKMDESFKEFAEQMVADNTQSLIDALTQVMKDFNSKINEQFGENFQQLNIAVGAMLEWQKEYKEHIDTLTTKFTLIADNLEGIDSTLKSTATSQETIYKTNDILNSIISDFSQTLSSFSELGEKAKESFPVIEKNMQALTDTSNTYVRDSLDDITKNYDLFSDTQRTLMNEYKESLDVMFKDSAERVQKLDVELGNELTKSLESLGSQLTSLSKHFVDDYTPLTKRLKEVLTIAEKAN